MTHIKDEALDLALEALEALHKHGDIACVVTPEREFRLPQVITAIKQALAKDALYKLAEESCTSGLRLDDWDKIGCVNHDCDKCKAVQEPVAWLIPGSITTDFELAKANGDKAVPLGEISKQQWNPKDHYEDGWRDALESVKRATPPGGRQSEDCLTAAPVQEPAIKQGWDVDTLLDKPAAQPAVPTKEMIDAAERIDWSDSDVRGNIINMWQAMTAAAPEKGQP